MSRRRRRKNTINPINYAAFGAAFPAAEEEEEDASAKTPGSREEDNEGDEDSAAAATDLNLVWDGGKFERGFDSDNKKFMRCLHCGNQWSSHNHTKALAHLLGGSSDIAKCKKLPEAWRQKYMSIRHKKEEKLQSKLDGVAKMNMSLDSIHEDIMVGAGYTTAAAASRRGSYEASMEEEDDEGGEGDNVFLAQLGSHHKTSTPNQHRHLPMKRSVNDALGYKIDRSSSSSKKKTHNKKRYQYQTNLVVSSGKNIPATKKELDVAIAMFCLALGLPFSIAQDQLFKRVLLRARDVNSSYEPPSRYVIGGPLLEATHAAYQLEAANKLLADAGTFGVSVFGDGATIDTVPLINSIAASAGNPCMVLDVIDCSEHCAAGGKKDAAFIVKKMLPGMLALDPKKELIDLVLFDGASNVQNAAKLLTIHFPRASVGPAIEHVVSLVFDKVMRLSPVSQLCKIAKVVSTCVVLCCSFTILTFTYLFTAESRRVWCTAPCAKVTLHSCV